MENFWERYTEYLESDWWKSTRAHCIQKYGGKCFCCGETKNLQVHHLTYEHLGFERDDELVCLCNECHKWIEDEKKNLIFLSKQAQQKLLEGRLLSLRKKNEIACLSTHYATSLFLSYLVKEKKDLSSHGKLNLTNISVIRTEFDKWCRQNNIKCGKLPVSKIQDYFRNRRYEIILKFQERNFPQSICYNRTLFSKAMIHKVYTNPEIAKRLLEDEKEENNNAETE